MAIIDSQIHIVGEDGAAFPWSAEYLASLGGALGEATRTHFIKNSVITDDQMLAAMEAVGVDAAILVVSSHYGWNSDYSLAAARKYPDRFRVVGKIDPQAPDVDEQVAAWKRDPMATALRFLVLSPDQRDQLTGGYFDPLLAACARHDVAISTYAAGHLDALEPVIRRFDGLTWIIDHLGLSQPPVLQPDPEPFERLPQLLALADVPGVVVKISGMPALSKQPYPYADLKAPFGKLVEAFGIDRLMWGTDWTRTKSLLPYRAYVTYLDDLGLLTAAEHRALFEDNCRRIFQWPA